MKRLQTHRDAIEQFREAIQSAGLTPPDQVVTDGTLHRFASDGKRGDDAGWYVLHGDGIAAGAFGCWRSGLKQTWRADIGRRLTPQELEQYRQRMEAAKLQREEYERTKWEAAAQQAVREWDAAEPAQDSHPYLTRKAVRAHGLRVDRDGCLLVPVFIGGELHSLQRIPADGKKRFLPGGRTSEGFYFIGEGTGTLCIAEGFATAATIHEVTGMPAVVAFTAHNLEPVARWLRQDLPAAKLIVCADDDAWTKDNPGVTKATAAARAVGGLLAVPDFGADRPSGATDFNDLAAHRGAEAVRACLAKVAAPAAEVWPEPEPLIGESEQVPYPLGSLPGAIGRAVREVADFVQCPEALPACSALSALSVAGQGLVNVRRGSALEGPVSLYLLTVAESGERKSECDKRFTAPLREWEAGEAQLMKPALAKYRADLSAWEQECEAVRAGIKQERKQGQSTEEKRIELAGLELNKPEPVRVPRVLLESETAENLAYSLRTEGWPSAGLLSSEAGVIFGGHAMRRDTQMQSMSLINKLWSGESHRVGRRTSESFDLIGARLTMGLAVQPGTVERFFEDSKGLARDTGFAARFLMAWPHSTQGTRHYKDPPADWPALTEFHTRLRRLLEEPLTFDDRGALTPKPLDMESDAFEAWKEVHNQFEIELRQGGELVTVRDVASKAAENVARMSGLFHLFEFGPSGRVSMAHVKAAATIVTWHLMEARRFLGGMALSKPLANALKLDGWLIATCRERGVESLPRREVMRLGPYSVRRKADLSDALAELTEASRARLEDTGLISVNPALLRDER